MNTISSLANADSIQLGWVSPAAQSEFCRFFGAFAGSTRLLAIRPRLQKVCVALTLVTCECI